MEKVIFTDPDTKETVELYVEEETQLNGVKYLLVSEEAQGDCDAYILKELKEEGEEITYQMVEDEVEFMALGKIFSELADEETNIEY